MIVYICFQFYGILSAHMKSIILDMSYFMILKNVLKFASVENENNTLTVYLKDTEIFDTYVIDMEADSETDSNGGKSVSRKQVLIHLQILLFALVL